MSAASTQSSDSPVTTQSRPPLAPAGGLDHLPRFFSGRSVSVERIEQEGSTSDAVTAQTIGYMHALANADSHAPIIRNAAAQATAGRTSDRDKIAGLFDYIKRTVKFRLDEHTALLFGLTGQDAAEAEILIRPAELLNMSEPAEDCDGFAMVSRSMLAAAGIPSAFKTVAADRKKPAEWSHVYVVAFTDAGPVPFDPSYGTAPGWEYSPVTRSHIWTAPTMQPSRLSGIDWNNVIDNSFTFLQSRYGDPAIAPGTYLQQGPDGTRTAYGQQPGSAAFQFPSAGPGGNSGLLLIGGVAVIGVLLVAMMAKK